MRRDLATLSDREFDLVVVGGGIFGACAARDAAQRGLSVALIERNDFAGATSAHSFKIVHGGIRYLQHADFRRLRKSSADRRTLLRVAPHLVRPLPIVVPTYGRGMRSKALLRLAMRLYDLAAFDRNAGILDRGRRIPRGRTLSKGEVLERFPGLPSDGLTGAGVFCDGQMYNPPRLVLAFVRSAVEEGAVAANHVEASRVLVRSGRAVGVEARDALSGASFEVRARAVLNAAGPYAETLIARSLDTPLEPPTPWSRDAYFLVDRALLPGPEALAVQGTTHDPDALLSRGARHLFLVPWHGSTLIGVWHKVYHGAPDEFTVEEAEIEGFLAEINSAYRDLDLDLGDVALWNAGLVPFGENEPESRDLRYGHRSRLVDHARENGPTGLFTLIGVRYTTGPSDADAAIDLVFRNLGRRPPPSRSSETPVHGGDIEDFDSLSRRAIEQAPPGVPAGAVRALVHNHGTEYDRVLDLIRSSPSLGQALRGSTVLRAEVLHALRREMAMSLADVVLRRTDLGTAGYPGREALEDTLALVAGELGWDAARSQDELAGLQRHYPPWIRSRPEAEEVAPR